jgi:hypothetical protein
MLLSGYEAPRRLSIPVSGRKPEGDWELKEVPGTFVLAVVKAVAVDIESTAQI